MVPDPPEPVVRCKPLEGLSKTWPESTCGRRNGGASRFVGWLKPADMPTSRHKISRSPQSALNLRYRHSFTCVCASQAPHSSRFQSRFEAQKDMPTALLACTSISNCTALLIQPESFRASACIYRALRVQVHTKVYHGNCNCRKVHAAVYGLWRTGISATRGTVIGCCCTSLCLPSLLVL